MEILTEEPTPIKSASEKLISTNGNAGLRAAKATSPSKFPTKIPSNNPHKEEAIMLIAPGIAIIKNSFTGLVFAYNCELLIFTLPLFALTCLHKFVV